MWFYKFARALCMGVIHILFRIKTVGGEQVPKNQGYILVSNHRTNFDPLFVAARVKTRINYMAKAELFKFKPLAVILKAVGAFEVDRGSGDTSAIDYSVELIKRGEVLGIFPEGHRSKDGKLQRIKSGASVVAMQTEADILPCAVHFTGKLRFRSVVTISYGPLIKFSELGFTPGENSPREIKRANKMIGDHIEALLEAVH